MPSFFSRHEDSLLRALPGIIIVLGTLLGLTPPPFAGGYLLMPSLAIIAIYFWSLLRADLAPYWLLFICGLVSDAMMATPLGVQALLFMLLKVAAQYISNRFDRGSIWVYWMGFAALSLAYWLAYWLLLRFLLDAPLAPFDSIRVWAVTAIFYPLPHWLFVRVLDKLP